MILWLLGRLGRAAVTVTLIVTFAFVVLRLSGDPAELFFAPGDTPPDVIEAFRKAWGLDQPIWVQYLRYVENVARGDLGNSIRENRPAIDTVMERLPMTLAIMVPALFVKLLLGLTAGVVAALYRNTFADRLIMGVSVFGFTVPSFVLGLLLALLFAVQFRLLPSGGSSTLAHYVLPVLTLGLSGAAVIARYTRSAMIEVMGQPYVRTASAKGVLWHRVVSEHVFPNAAIPIITVIGFMIGSLVAGAVVVETVFSWPGVGSLLVNSVNARDLAVVQVILLLVGFSMVAANLAVDLLYGFIDPRLHRARGGED